MVDVMWLAISASAGLMVYLAIPVLGNLTPTHTRNKIAQFYWKMSTRSFGWPSITRRSVGGYDIKEAKADDEKGAGKVTLNTGLLGDDKDLHFDDPDNRLSRLHSKPMVLLHELVPAVIDAQLAELGYWWRRHKQDGKHWKGEKFNPHFAVPTKLRVVNLDDVMPLILNGAEPTDPTTMEDYTHKRFEKYRKNIGAAEVMVTFTGFAIGIGGMALLQYIQNEVIGSGGGGGPSIIGNETIQMGMDPGIMTDVAVMAL